MGELDVPPRCIDDMRMLAAGLLAAVACVPRSSPPPSSQIATPTPAVTGFPATVDRFLDAFNAGDVAHAMSLVADDVLGSDCDYRASSVVVISGRDSFAAWMRERAADHDRLVRGDFQAGQDGAPVLGMPVINRTSDTLRALGFTQGIRQQIAAKVILSSDGLRIKAFANGPGGGDPDLCRAR